MDEAEIKAMQMANESANSKKEARKQNKAKKGVVINSETEIQLELEPDELSDSVSLTY